MYVDMKRLTKIVISAVVLSGLVGFLGGFLTRHLTGPGADEVKIHIRENGWRAARIYTDGLDQVLPEHPERVYRGKFIPMNDYLRARGDRKSQEAERREILRAVGYEIKDPVEVETKN